MRRQHFYLLIGLSAAIGFTLILRGPHETIDVTLSRDEAWQQSWARSGLNFSAVERELSNSRCHRSLDAFVGCAQALSGGLDELSLAFELRPKTRARNA